MSAAKEVNRAVIALKPRQPLVDWANRTALFDMPIAVEDKDLQMCLHVKSGSVCCK